MRHDLIWYENRNTPEVVPRGSKGKKGGPGTAAGKQVKRRPATPAEEQKMAGGKWLRIDKHDRTPGTGKGYGTGSAVRPQFNKNYTGPPKKKKP